jgi:succinylarginine dihydrolase
MTTREFNFDGLVGPTHNYSGLSFGNVASSKNQGSIANPKLAALQGLAKLKRLADLGFAQGVLAPQARPDIDTLRQLGFAGSDADMLARAAKESPALLSGCYSASSMWTANAATVSASADTADGKVHFTPANLNNKFHRSIEHPTTARILRAVFPGERFVHHDALPACPQFGDEGAANHTRLTRAYGEPGVELFVYGCSGFDLSQPAPKKFPARQTLEASQAIARLHGLDGSRGRAIFAQQNPDVIDAGVFHNDVIAVGNGPVLFHHQEAFLGTPELLRTLRDAIGGSFVSIQVPTAEVAVEDAVQSYLFNSQLLTKADGKMLLVVPSECDANIRVKTYLAKLVDEGQTRGGPIDEVLVMDLRESMKNGGGPACLRLRVELSDAEANAVNPAVLMNDALYATLTAWVEKYYRDRLAEQDLADPALLNESRTSVDELTRILKLGNVYAFQRQA